MTILASVGFPSLIGSSKTRECRRVCGAATAVSIPHRKFKNQAASYYRKHPFPGFHPSQEVQKPYSVVCKIQTQDMFPSLIGSSKTVSGVIVNTDYLAFPSLIGSSKTCLMAIGEQARSSVSIPHRKFKNDLVHFDSAVNHGSFHPSQEVQKLCSVFYLKRCLSSFHPSQEVQKPRRSWAVPKSIFVSIPHRKFKNKDAKIFCVILAGCFHPSQEVQKREISDMGFWPIYGFPSLIGSSKTVLCPPSPKAIYCFHPSQEVQKPQLP